MPDLIKRSRLYVLQGFFEDCITSTNQRSTLGHLSLDLCLIRGPVGRRSRSALLFKSGFVSEELNLG